MMYGETKVGLAHYFEQIRRNVKMHPQAKAALRQGEDIFLEMTQEEYDSIVERIEAREAQEQGEE